MVAVDPKNLDWLSYLRYIFLKCILWWTKAERTHRYAALYDYNSNDPLKYGAIPNPREFEEEWPYKKDRMENKKINDGLTVFCTSKDGQILNISITRRPDGRALLYVYLRTLKSSYVLPKSDVYIDLSAGDTFAVDGLRVECVIPNRKWRISFNGLMRNTASGQDDHVRFVFTGNFGTSLADLSMFHSDRLLALQLSRSLSISPLQLLFKPSLINEQLLEIDSIVQTYSFVGKVRTTENVTNAEPHEEEVFAFGQKKRFHEKHSSPIEYLGTLQAYTRNGISVYLEEQNIRNFTPSLTSGVIVYPALIHCNLDFADLEVMKGNRIEKTFSIGSDGVPLMELNINEKIDEFSTIELFNSEYRERKCQVFKIILDGREGHAIFKGALGNRVECTIPQVPRHLRGTERRKTRSNTLSFEDQECENEGLTGGKASSLAVLTTLSKQSEKFSVASGFAVTTNAYAIFAKLPEVAKAIQEVKDAVVAKTSNEHLQNICENVVKKIGSTKIPDEIKRDVETTLQNIFTKYDQLKFAVRSSACGEDSEDMSAAGQMETFLGIRGLANICDAVAKCWASQFSFIAIQYRRRYGQAINCPMAVCVQEMVASEVSGVMFTVDPVSANPKYITITANYGLGESVVSASADPDTFVLEKTPQGGRLVSSTIGAKKLRTILLEDGGTKDVTEFDDTNTEGKACLSDEQLQLLAKVAQETEKHYASQRDTEWAFAPDGQLFMLQARPVTSSYVLDTDFEIYHEGDDSVTSEYDCLSKANIGEVLGGSVSILTFDTMFKAFIREMKAMETRIRGLKPWQAIFNREQFLVRQNSQSFFLTTSVTQDYSKDDMFSKGFAIAMNGRLIHEDEPVKICAENRKRYMPPRNAAGLKMLIRFASDLWEADKVLQEAENYVKNTQYSLADCKNIKEMYMRIISSPQMSEKALTGHSRQIVFGSINNVIVLGLLAQADGGWTTKVFGDFAKLVASCNNVVSADVPLSMQRLALQVEKDYGEAFKVLSEEEALHELRIGSTASARLFADFLRDHGHRCFAEFNLASRPWSMEPLPVVKSIQSMVGNVKIEERPDVDTDKLIDSLEIKLTPIKKRILRFILSRVRKAISNRERGKSILILSTHKYRLLFLELGEKMVAEGLIPEPDLLFHMHCSEIYQLIETRSPKIVIRAMNRRRIAAKADKDVYAELTPGLPFNPINTEVRHEIKGSRQITGTPVSQGSIVATARVVLKLEDAHHIKKGDILITYATDIGWSPYFPLLGGVVTELGGLISHGAVVAREYGLPCIVAAHGATRTFRSGEKVFLDGNKGILQTVDDDEQP